MKKGAGFPDINVFDILLKCVQCFHYVKPLKLNRLLVTGDPKKLNIYFSFINENWWVLDIIDNKKENKFLAL